MSSWINGTFEPIFIGVIANLIFIGIVAFWVKVSRKKDDLKNTTYHLDSVSMSLIDQATKLLPSEDRARYREEWFAHLCQLPTASLRLRHAADCWRGACRIASESYVFVPVGNVISNSVTLLRETLRNYNKTVLRLTFDFCFYIFKFARGRDRNSFSVAYAALIISVASSLLVFGFSDGIFAQMVAFLEQ